MKKLNSLTKKAAFLAVAASLILIESGHAASIPNCGVNVYALSNAGVVGDLLCTTTTAADGSYTCSTIPESYTGGLKVVIASGCSYIDDATGLATTTSELATVVPQFTGSATDVAVNPLTDLAAGRAIILAGSKRGSLQELQLPKQLSFLFLVCLPVQIYFEPCRPTLARH